MTTVSPITLVHTHDPRSTSQVKIVKKTIQKAQETKSDVNIALLCLRATPVSGKIPSPAELLYKRTIQDNLPRRFSKEITDDQIIQELVDRQKSQKYYHDQHIKSLPPLVQGQSVKIQNKKEVVMPTCECKSTVSIIS